MPSTQRRHNARKVIKRCEGSIDSILDCRKDQNIFCMLQYLFLVTDVFLIDILENDRQQAADGYLFYPSGIGMKFPFPDTRHYDCHLSNEPCDSCPLLVSPKMWTMLLTFLEEQCKYFIDIVHTLERSSSSLSNRVSSLYSYASSVHQCFHGPSWNTVATDQYCQRLLSGRFKVQECCDRTLEETLFVRKDGLITRIFMNPAGNVYSTWSHPLMPTVMMKEIINIRVDAFLGGRHPELMNLMSRFHRQDIEELLSQRMLTQLSPGQIKPVCTECDGYIYILWTHPSMSAVGYSSNPQRLSGGTDGHVTNAGVNVTSPCDQEIPSKQQKVSREIEQCEASINSILDYRKDQNMIPTVFCLLRYLHVAASLFLNDILENNRQRAADKYTFFHGFSRKICLPNIGNFQCNLPKDPCDSCPLLISPKLWTMLLSLLEGQFKYFTFTVHTLEKSNILPGISALQNTTEPFHRLLLNLDDRSLWNTYVANDHRGHFLSGRFKVQECCDTTRGEIIYLRKSGRFKRSLTNPERGVYFDLLRSMHPELMTLISSSCSQEIEQLMRKGDMTIGFTQLCPHQREPVFTERDKYFYRLWTHPEANIVGYSTPPSW